MKTKLVIAFLMSVALVACGGKAKKSTTPDNKSDTHMGSGTGGSTYGGAMTGSGAMPAGGADPCAGQ
jgi:hypothetical protein